MLKVNRDDERPIWQQLLAQAIYNITTGKWPPGELLLPSRELAQLIGVSRSTIQTVYEELFSRGYTVTSRRGGTRVSEWIYKPGSADEVPAQGPVLPEMPLLNDAISHLHNWFGDKGNGKDEIDFTPHEPYVDEHLLKNWRHSFLQASTETDLDNWAYGDAYGFLPLREQIQRYLSLERGIHVEIDQILMTSGAQHSLDLIAQALLHEGATVSVEDPGFPAAWMAMKIRRMQVDPVPVDEYGLCVDRIHPESKLVFVTPSHQCAVGVIMSEPRRQQLLHMAAEKRFWIIEDDYDSEFRWGGRPIEPLKVLDREQRVIYVGSFSQTMVASFRLGYAVLPPGLVEPLLAAKALYEPVPPALLEQRALAKFMTRGGYLRHLRRLTRLYGERHDFFVREMELQLPEAFKMQLDDAGLHIYATWNGDVDSYQRFKKLAEEDGILFRDAERYRLTSGHPAACFAFAHLEKEEMTEGIRRMRLAWEKCTFSFR